MSQPSVSVRIAKIGERSIPTPPAISGGIKRLNIERNGSVIVKIKSQIFCAVGPLGNGNQLRMILAMSIQVYRPTTVESRPIILRNN